jgi:serine kinase of HPr protein (carbohydrate metabolism regulator)
MRSGDRAPLRLASRALLPFHASTATCDGRAVLIAGPAGAGKSTLALTALGARWLADDLVWRP